MSDSYKGNIMIKKLALLLLVAASSSAWAQGTLDVNTTVQKETVVVTEEGEEVRELVPAETVIPGERVVYTITFRNTGAEPADNVIITNPISENLTYVAESAFGPGMVLEFSVDGGETFAAADDLTIEEDGESRPASAEDYTHIRWVMQDDLASGAQGMARFTAQLK